MNEIYLHIVARMNGRVYCRAPVYHVYESWVLNLESGPACSLRGGPGRTAITSPLPDVDLIHRYYKGRLVGSMGDFASWSFQGSKHVTCGDGGILCCSDEEKGTRARKACVFGFKTAGVGPVRVYLSSLLYYILYLGT